MRLPDDAEVNDGFWDQMIDSMMLRMGDKIPVIRTFAIRALSRFVNDSENSDILELFLQTLDSEQNAVCDLDAQCYLAAMEFSLTFCVHKLTYC